MHCVSGNIHLDRIDSKFALLPIGGWGIPCCRNFCFHGCRIQYTSGEIEELDLEEIIRLGHMSLITQ